MKKKICFCTTLGGTISAFLVDFSLYLVEHENYDVTFICNNSESLSKYCSDNIHFIPVKMKRGISFDAFRVINDLTSIFKKEHFDIVQYATPNASFYASIAAKLAGVKNRLYTHWGSRYMGYERGIGRFLFKTFEKITCWNSTIIETESFSLMDYSIKDGLYPQEKVSVIWNGSACGVKLKNYDLSNREAWRRQIRDKYGIPNDAIVFGWCGRITRDKGHNELFEAFRKLNETNKKARLLMVGAYDNVETIDQELFKWAQDCNEVIFTGPVPSNQVPAMYSAMDVFCSLSYREGFGLVVIEAAAMNLPGIVTDVPGQIDTIVKDETGLQVPAKAIDPVVKAMEYYIDNPDRIEEMGTKARKRVEEEFEQKQLFAKLAAHRNEIISKNQGH